jgi:hypothetical protein
VSELTPSISSQDELRHQVARRRITSFSKQFGQAHLYLAYHAAFPLALTSDLLYRLWANFPRDIHGKPLNIPWIAVADLLLSNLCDEVGRDLYEMNVTVRTELLSGLKTNANFGGDRIEELADFLLAYVRQRLDSPSHDIRSFAQAQQWTALAYIRPHVAAREITLALSSILEQDDREEQIRLASLVEIFTEQLSGFTPLLLYAKGITHFARGEIEDAVIQFNKLASREKVVEVEGVKLRIPAKVQQAIIGKGDIRVPETLSGEPEMDMKDEITFEQVFRYRFQHNWALRNILVNYFVYWRGGGVDPAEDVKKLHDFIRANGVFTRDQYPGIGRMLMIEDIFEEKTSIRKDNDYFYPGLIPAEHVALYEAVVNEEYGLNQELIKKPEPYTVAQFMWKIYNNQNREGRLGRQYGSDHMLEIVKHLFEEKFQKGLEISEESSIYGKYLLVKTDLYSWPLFFISGSRLINNDYEVFKVDKAYRVSDPGTEFPSICGTYFWRQYKGVCPRKPYSVDRDIIPI